jgi:hypothetical protein
MGALITGLSSLIQPALSTILGGASTNQTSTQNSLASLFAPQSGTGSTSGSGVQGLGQLMASLQQLQQSNPTQYAQVTGQIATNLQSAAQSATASGNTKAASFLNNLATDFSNASTSGQMPSFQDLSKTVGGHHHHCHSGSSTDPTSDSTNSSSTGTFAASSTTTGQSLDQLLASLQNSQSATNAINPLSIINSTLTAAGITV